MNHNKAKPVGRVARLLSALLHERILNVDEAAQRMGLAKNRAAEIIEEFAAEFPWVRYERDGRRKLVKLIGVAATESEPKLEVGLAACFGASIASLFAGTRYHAGMRDALKLVVTASPNPSRFAELERRFVFLARGGEMAFEDRSLMLEHLARAVLERQKVEFQYQGFDEKDARVDERAEPWSIAIHRHQLYVIGRRESDGRTWIWRLARMYDMRVLADQRFEYPSEANYDPAHLFDESFGIWLQPDAPLEKVEVLLADRWGAYARSHRWHRSQPATPAVMADGRILIQLELKICRELKEWILGFGPDAEVVRPQHLRIDIARKLARAASLYPDVTAASSTADTGR